MTLSIWRYSHLTLAISSSIFLLIASITGIILAFEPVTEQLLPYHIDEADEQSLGKTIEILKNKYSEVIDLKVDHNDFIAVSVITHKGESEQFYINPITGKKIGDLIKQKPIYKFAANLHRSLFLKSVGRFFVGFVSFLLFLIAITGTILIIKRQNGVKAFFSKIIKESSNQYYHIVLGRWTLIPIIIITVTGVYLSCLRFELIPEDRVKHEMVFEEEIPEKKSITTIPFFQKTKLSSIKSIEFPFSDDVEDYYTIQLSDMELLVNQYTGKSISTYNYSDVAYWNELSSVLHTGKGNMVWAIVLLVACINIIYFMYSGFKMTFKRRAGKNKNKLKAEEAEYIILVGSETGGTNKFANAFKEALIQSGKKCYVTDLNKYKPFDAMKHLILMTSTYGNGEAPINAKKFESLFDESQLSETIGYSVLGFGSVSYPDFCQYAIEVDQFLARKSKLKADLELFKINNKSKAAFLKWVRLWSDKHQLELSIDESQLIKDRIKTKSFEVISKTDSKENPDQTFLISLNSSSKTRFKSGDLLAVYANEEEEERLYSISKNEDNSILLSIKVHEKGLCSNYLNDLKLTDKINASVIENIGFHLPKTKRGIILIANGTGIAPFLGMINETKAEANVSLYWGGRTEKSFDLYNNKIQYYLQENKLNELHLALSRERDKVYVQDLIARDKERIAEALKNKGYIMICGSLAMKKEVVSVIGKLCKAFELPDLEELEEEGFIRSDCY